MEKIYCPYCNSKKKKVICEIDNSNILENSVIKIRVKCKQCGSFITLIVENNKISIDKIEN